jgi:LssY C-terminus
MSRQNLSKMFRRFLLLTLLFFPVAELAQNSTQNVKVAGNQVWTDTKIDVQAGDKIRLTGSGTIQYPTLQPSGPEGLARGWRDLLRAYPVTDGNRGALIGRIGSADTAQAFLVGGSKDLVVPQSARLFLGINQQDGDAADGSFNVKVEILEKAPKPASPVSAKAAAVDAPIPGITPDLLKKIPRRVADKAGNPGDMVNFLIIGSEENLREAFKDAGWVLVDKTESDAVLHGILATLSKQAYLEMPMSELYLFGRSQDFGFAHAEPISVVASRNHLRIWKAPFAVDGQTFWVGAATHDTGFEKDQRNGNVTHKIDPDIDKEREYLGETLNGTGIVTQLSHVVPPDPLKGAKTATGGTFHSDGRILVMVLKTAAANQTAKSTGTQ